MESRTSEFILLGNMGDDYEWEPMSASEKTNATRTLCAQAPAGEMKEVWSDVKKLVDDGNVATKEIQTEVFRKHNLKHMQPVTVPGSDFPSLITKHGEISPDAYFDPRSGKTMNVDHIGQSVASVSDGQNMTPSGIASFRTEVEKQLDEYTKAHYPNGASVVYGTDDGLIICIASNKENLRNFWTGKWCSEWTLAYKPGASSGALSGKMWVNVHYFEDGNIQLDSDVSRSATVSISDETAGAKAVVEAIKGQEMEYHKGMATSFNDLSDTTFKQLRRKRPINVQKFEWDSAGSHALASELSKK